jgi:pilus assembly protein CpaE
VKRNICVHNLPEIEPSMLPDFFVTARTSARPELLDALSAQDLSILVIDLDAPDAFPTVVQALEVRPNLGVVGVTATGDLSHVINAQRAGCKQLTTRPIDPADLVVAIRRTLNVSSDEGKPNHTIALFGSVGGAGTTALACNLAVELATLQDGRCAIFDLDFEFGGVARAFDLTPQFTIADLAAAGAVDAVLLSKAATELASRVDVIARPPQLRDAHVIDDNAIRSIVRTAQHQYPFVVLDLPRRIDPVVGAAVEASHTLLLVVQLTVPAIDNASRVLEALREEGVPSERIQIVVNRFRKGTHTISLELVEERLKRKPIAIIPSDYQAVYAALDTGRSLATKNPVRSAIADLARRIAGDNVAPAKKNSWFSGFGLSRSTASTQK